MSEWDDKAWADKILVVRAALEKVLLDELCVELPSEMISTIAHRCAVEVMAHLCPPNS